MKEGLSDSVAGAAISFDFASMLDAIACALESLSVGNHHLRVGEDVFHDVRLVHKIPVFWGSTKSELFQFV